MIRGGGGGKGECPILTISTKSIFSKVKMYISDEKDKEQTVVRIFMFPLALKFEGGGGILLLFGTCTSDIYATLDFEGGKGCLCTLNLSMYERTYFPWGNKEDLI